MNNKGLSIINLILTVMLIGAVAYLFTSNPKSISSKDEVVLDDSLSKKVNLKNENDTIGLMGQLRVVYINTDTLWENYEFVKTTLKGLEREQKRLQSTYESKMTKLEKDYSDYMQKGKANQLSLKQQQDLESSLEKQQNEIKKLEEEVTNKLVVKKQELNQQINDTIQAFLNRYRVVNEYDMILQHSYLNGILSATSEIDITKDALSKLNAEYKRFKK